MSKTDPLSRLQALVKRYGSQKAAAAALGISQVYMCDLLKGRRLFSETMLAKLGLRRTIIESKAS